LLELVLSSLAGLAVAVSIKKIPRRESGTGELAIERDIITKTITRVHNSGLPQNKRSILLSKYQEQLESITNRIEGRGSGYADPRLHSLLERMNQSMEHMSKRLDDISGPAAHETVQNAAPDIQARPEARAKIPQEEGKKRPAAVAQTAGQSRPSKAKAGPELTKSMSVTQASQNGKPKTKADPGAGAMKKSKLGAYEALRKPADASMPGKIKQETGGPLPKPAVASSALSDNPNTEIPEDDKLDDVVREISAKLAELKKIEAE